LDFQNCEILSGDRVQTINMLHHAKFHADWSGQAFAEIKKKDFSISQNDSHPPQWICYTRVYTTHEKYLLVFVTVFNCRY